VRSNGGGIICLQQAISETLEMNDWNINSNNRLFEAFDYREWNLTEIFFNTGVDFAGEFLNPKIVPTTPYATGDNSWYEPGDVYTRGDSQSTYSPKHYYPSYCDTIFPSTNPMYEFSKILILTDGLCGSACSQFASKLRYHGKALTVGVGGIYGQPLEMSSFTGGNVEDWANFVGQVQQVTEATGLEQLPTTAATRFNHNEMYMGNDTIPREFKRFETDFRIDTWQLVPHTLSDLLNVYLQTTPFFSNPLFHNNTAMGPYFDDMSVSSTGTTGQHSGVERMSAGSIHFLFTIFIVAVFFAH